MKTKLMLLGAVIAVGHSAYAQSSSSSVDTSTAASAAPSSITSDQSAAVANGSSSAIKPKVTYLGVMQGPGLEFSGKKQSALGSNGDMYIDNRPKAVIQTSENFGVGLEARVNTIFATEGMQAKNGNYRLLANFKNVYKDDVFAASLTPRLVLPTSNRAHDSDMKISPELIASLDVSPRNSRFTASTGFQYIHQIFGNKAASEDLFQGATTAVLAPWLEIDYQLSPSTQLMVSYWPELVAFARQGAPLATDSNEVDIGAYYEFAKGWQLNPYIGTQLLGVDTAHLDKSMQINLALTGTFL